MAAERRLNRRGIIRVMERPGADKKKHFRIGNEEVSMPIYEYRCLSCGRNFQLLLLNRRDVETAACPSCGAAELKKLISRTSYHRSEKDRLESFDPAQAQCDGFYSDTRNIGLSAKKRAERMGVDLGGEFESKLDTLRSDPGRVFDGGD